MSVWDVIQIVGENNAFSTLSDALNQIPINNKSEINNIKVGDTIIYIPVAAKYRPDDTKTGDNQNIELEICNLKKMKFQQKFVSKNYTFKRVIQIKRNYNKTIKN